MTLVLAWLVGNALKAALGATRFGPAINKGAYLVLGAAVVLVTAPSHVIAAALHRLGLARTA